jgi:hypothetical protein
MMNDEIKVMIVKAGLSITVLLAEYYLMSGTYDNLLAKLWYYLSCWCYKLAYISGTSGLMFERKYYEAVE